MSVHIAKIWDYTGAEKFTELQVPSTSQWNTKVFDGHQDFFARLGRNAVVAIGTVVLDIISPTSYVYTIPSYSAIVNGILITGTAEQITIDPSLMILDIPYAICVNSTGVLSLELISGLTDTTLTPLFSIRTTDNTITYISALYAKDVVVNGHLFDGTGGGGSYTAGDAIDLTSNIISVKVESTTMKINTSNEIESNLSMGDAIDITSGVVSVKVDNDTIKLNGSNEIYADVDAAVAAAILAGVTIDGGGDV